MTREFSGKTVEEAIEEGLKVLNLTREQAEITVIDEQSSGFLRFKKARVSIKQRLSDALRATAFLDELLDKMQFHATSELKEEEDRIVINLITTNSANIIGYRGEVLDAFQILAGAVANIGRDDYKRVVVDCENYREKREETLIKLASRLADKAVTKARRLSLEPMNAYERRIIHSALSNNKEIKTLSEGKEPNRFIVIVPNNAKFDFDSKHSGKRGAARGGKNRPTDRKSSSRYNQSPDRLEGEFRGNSSRAQKRESTNFQRASSTEKPVKKMGFGTYLGNSLKY